MRMMLRFTVPTEDCNRGVKDGSLPKAIQETMRKLKTGAAYFAADQGVPECHVFLRHAGCLGDPTHRRALELLPVMNADDLKLGINTAAQAK